MDKRISGRSSWNTVTSVKRIQHEGHEGHENNSWFRVLRDLRVESLKGDAETDLADALLGLLGVAGERGGLHEAGVLVVALSRRRVVSGMNGLAR